jgi:hypothetical protein
VSFKLSFPLLLILLYTLLTACSGNQSLEGRFKPDPNLQQNSTATPSPSPSLSPTLSTIFPSEIPRYPQAQLLTIEPNSTAEKGITRWNSPSPSNLIASYYQQQFTTDNWQIIEDFPTNPTNKENTLTARKDNLEVKLSITPTASTTEFTIAYQKESTPTPSPSPTPTFSPSPVSFSDLNSLAQPLRGYIEDLGNLGVLTPYSGTNQFKPNAAITRREYARWLVTANNRIYATVPAKQIRPVSQPSQPAFQDVTPKDADFPYIQGLAEAGLIPSQLTGDTSALLFRPNAPLTRENLIQWKVPLDSRKALPSASLDTIKQTWGFQDTSKIDAKALPSLYADFQNGDQSNIRRIFGYTTLFQPKKPVTRAEAAAALWYFGFQGEGISAQDALQGKREE